MASPALVARGVWKKYSRTLHHTMRYGATDLARAFLGLTPAAAELREGEFWALEGVDLELGPGDSLGIVGVNGSGKSTLLKILNGILMPDRGEVRVRGRTGALIEVGAGFHPLLTGRENVFVAGAILGVGRRELAARLDSIIDFAGVEQFLDVPLKHYSSGMRVRLGFAVAVHCEPAILLVDEVLAVGDLGFVVKCARKIQDFVRGGGILVLVAHSMQAIRNNTREAMHLHKGKPLKVGSVHAVCDHYEQLVWSSPAVLGQGQRIRGNEGSEITSVEVLPAGPRIAVGAAVEFQLTYRCERPCEEPVFVVSLFTMDGILAASSYSTLDGLALARIEGEGTVRLGIPSLNLTPGTYFVSACLASGNVSRMLDWHDRMYTLVVEGPFHEYGILDLRCRWSHAAS